MHLLLGASSRGVALLELQERLPAFHLQLVNDLLHVPVFLVEVEALREELLSAFLLDFGLRVLLLAA